MCTEGCAGGYAERCAESVIIRNLKFEVYFKLLCPFCVVDSLKTLKIHHCPCLPLVAPSKY